MHRKFTALITSALLTGCLYSVEKEVSLNAAPEEDTAYAKVASKALQSADVTDNFETKFKLRATYLSPEFRTAFSKRLAEVYRTSQSSFEEADSKAGFFVSIYGPDSDKIDLTNQYHWNIFMVTKDGPLKPVLVKKIADKIRWQPFFTQVNPWTTEYLIVFDTPSVNANAPELVEKTGIAVTFANADAQVTLQW